MMVFGKQNSAEAIEKSNNSISRSVLASINDRKADDSSSNQDSTSTTISRLLPIQPDNIPMNLISRYDATISNQLTSIHRV